MKNTEKKLSRDIIKFILSPKRIVFFIFASFVFTGFILINADRMQVFAVEGINETINFQGKVVNSDGTNVADGEYTFVFRLYNVASGGTHMWTETQSNVQVTAGIFRVSLGSVSSLSGINFNDDSIYLGINFNSDGEMTPRIRFASVPYAFNAQKVAGLTVTDTTGTLTIPDSTTIQFGGAFTTSAQDLTLTLTGSTDVTLPTTGTLSTLGGVEILTNKSIGSTGLTFAGASTDITTGTDEDLVISANGTGNVLVQSQSGGDAALIVDKTGDGDIFSASSSGTTRFTIDNSGNIAAAGSVDLETGGGSVNLSTGSLTFSSTGNITLAGGVISDTQDEVDIDDNLAVAGNITLTGTTGITLTGAGADIIFANNEAIRNDTDGTLTFARNDAGTVTLTAADNDATAALVITSGGAAALTLDAGGAAALNLGTTNATSAVLGSSSLTSFTVTTTGTGDSTVVLPNQSIGSSEMVNNAVGFTQISNSSTLDATTTFSLSTSNLVINADSSGDFVIQDATTNFAQFLDDGTITLGKSAAAGTLNFGIGTGIDTISIGTDTTAGDVILIGNNNASTTLGLTGGDDWSVTTAGAATFSSLTGSGLSDCDGANSKLLWNDTNGQFSCGTEASGSGEDVDVGVTAIGDTTLANSATQLAVVSVTPTNNSGDIIVRVNFATRSLSNTDQTITAQIRDGSGCSGTILASNTASLTSSSGNNGPSISVVYLEANAGNTTQTYTACALSSTNSGAGSTGGVITAEVIDTSPSSGGGGNVAVRESDSSPSIATTTTIEFGPATTSSDEFIVTDEGSGIARIRLGDQVPLLNSTETVASSWTFSSVGYFNGGLSTSTTDQNLAFSANGAGDFVFNIDSDTAVSLTGGSDGVTALGITAGDILLSDGDLTLSGGDFNVTLDTADTANITKSSAAAGDVMSIVGSSANSIDGLDLDITATSDSGVDTLNGINITWNESSDADVFTALNIANTTSTNSTTTGVSIGTGYDTAIVTNNGNINAGTGTLTASTWTGSGSVQLSLGGGSITQLVVTTDGTGDDEVQLPGGSISSSEILNGTITTDDLASTLTFTNGDYLDFGGITHGTTDPMGIRLPQNTSFSNPSSGEGYIAYNTSTDSIVVFNGSTWVGVSGGGDFDDVYDSAISNTNFTMEIDNANGLAFNLNSTGSFAIQDGGSAFATFADDGSVTLGKASQASVINLGLGTAADTVYIGTDNTTGDTITIGNDNSSTLVSLTGGDDWSITTGGIADFSQVTGAGLTSCNGAGDKLLWDSGTFSCGTDVSGGGSGTASWDFNVFDGTIYPINNSTDILLGGNSTASAKFGFLNIASETLTPVASISAQDTTDRAISIDASGSITTTNKNSLTLGGGDSGNVVLGSQLILSDAANVGISGGGLSSDCSNPTTAKLLWNSTTNKFSCGTDQGGSGGSLTVRESDLGPAVSAVATLEFGPATTSTDEFIITEESSGVARVRIGNQVALLNQAETVTGGWTFNTGNTTFTTAVNLNGGLTTTDTNQNLAFSANGTGDFVFNIDSGTNVQLTGGTDGTDALVISAGDILLSDGDFDMSGGDFNVSLDSSDTFNITSTTANNGDIFSVVGTSTNAVNGASITLSSSADSGADAYQGLSFTWNESTDADTFTAIAIGNTTTTNSVTTAINIGTGWDTGITVGSGGVTISAGGLGVTGGLTMTDGTLAVNGGSITSTQSTLTINAGGTVEIQDSLTVTGPNGLTFTGSGADITFTNGETIDNDTNGVFTLGRNDAGTVTLTVKDNDSTAGLTITSGGAAALILDTGGAAVLSVGTSNAAGVSIGNGATATNNITLSKGSSGNFILQSNGGAFDCSGFDNGGKLSTNSSGHIVCGNDGGGASNFDDLGGPVASNALDMGATAQSFTWSITSNSALDAFSFDVTNSASGDSTTQRGLVIDNLDDGGSNGVTDVLLAITNSDTNEAVTTGILITAAGGGMTTALDLSDPDIATALSFAENNISGTNFTITGSSGATVIGTGGNTITLDPTSGPIYAGTARPTKTISLQPEYAGAVLSTFYGAGTDTNVTGAMTSDTDTSVSNNLRNYYQWLATSGTLQQYTVAVRVKLPKDFSAWATTNAMQIDFVTQSTSTANNFLDARVYLESNITTAVASSTSNASGTAGVWNTITIDDSVLDDASAPEWDAADETVVIYLRMGSANSNYTRIGEIRLNYLSSF